MGLSAILRAERHGRPLVWHLAIFAAALAAPVFVFIAVLMAQVATSERARYERVAADRAGEIAEAVDRELAGFAAAARALATDPALAQGRLAGFATRARDALAVEDADVLVTTRDGTLLLDTRANAGPPSDANLADGAGEAIYAWDRLSPSGAVVSDLILSPAGPAPTVTVSARAELSDGTPILVSIALPAARFLSDKEVAAPFTASLFDRRGVLLARSRAHEEHVGIQAPESLLARTADGSGIFYAANRAGEPSLFGYARTRLGQWTVLAFVPEDVARAGWRTMLTTLAGLGVGLVALAAGLATWYGRQASAAIGRLARMARAVGDGETPAPVATPVREANEVGEALALAARNLRERGVELGESERRLRAVLDSLIALVAVLEPDGTLVEINRAPLRATRRTRAEVIGRKLWDALPWSADAEARAVLRRAVREAAAGASPRFDLEAPRGDGTRIVLDLQISPLRDATGGVSRLVVSALDITARERAAADLRESEERLRLAVEAGRLGSYEVTLASDRCLVTPRTAEIFGVPAAALSHHADWMQFVLPEDRGLVGNAIGEALGDGGRSRCVFRVVRPTGEIRFVASSALVERDADARPVRLIGVLLDVTDERRAVEEMRRTSDLLRVIGETTPDPIWVRDAHGRFAFVNPALARLLGTDAAALIGETGESAEGVERAAQLEGHPQIAAFDSDLAVIGAGAPVVVEEEALPPFEHRRTYLVSKTPMRDERGRVTGLVCVGSDISDRKRSEERQTLMVRELHHRVKNSLATVQAIANATARTATDIAAFREAFNARIISLARTHTLLTENAWGVIPLRDLLEAELSPYETAPEPAGETPRVRLDGPDVALPSDVALSIGMAVHELTTNAVKYGALSTPAGRLAVAWSVVTRDGRRGLSFTWTESHGPPVSPPKRQGFGTRLLRHMLGGQFNSDVDMRFDPEGLVFTLSVPLIDRVAPGERAAAAE